MLSARLSGFVRSIADVKEWLLQAEALGHTNKTVVGMPGVGLEIWIETGQIALKYKCGSFGDCNTLADGDDMARQLNTGNLLMPYHMNTRNYICSGSGKPGVAQP